MTSADTFPPKLAWKHGPTVTYLNWQIKRHFNNYYKTGSTQKQGLLLEESTQQLNLSLLIRKFLPASGFVFRLDVQSPCIESPLIFEPNKAFSVVRGLQEMSSFLAEQLRPRI
jgi:hypothetical protein